MAKWDPIDCETHEYRNPAGESIRWLTLKGTTGRFMPPIQVTSIPVPAGHGSRYLGSAHLERPLMFPVAFPGIFDGRAELRQWARVLDPAKGEGTVTVVQGDWPGRQIRCVYEAGLNELEETGPDVNPGILMFRAAWPYWVDGSESSVDVGQGETESKWFPFLPLILGASDAFASFTVQNDGDVEAWPIVTVVGPGQELEVRNDTTGALWHITGSIASGESAVVDTRPGVKTVKVGGVNAFNRLTPDSSLWPLVAGSNRVTVSAAITDPATIITFTWRRQWLAA